MWIVERKQTIFKKVKFVKIVDNGWLKNTWRVSQQLDQLFATIYVETKVSQLEFDQSSVLPVLLRVYIRSYWHKNIVQYWKHVSIMHVRYVSTPCTYVHTF